jgi:hypothetical protein
MFGIDFSLCDSIWEILFIVALIAIGIVVWFIVVIVFSAFISWAVEFFFGDEIVDLRLLRTIIVAIGFSAPLFIIKGGE